jgi:ribosomal protein S18 acetylase RimI-like enzyme
MTAVRIVDALATGRVQAARDVAFEYVAMTQGETGSLVPQDIYDLPEPLRSTLDDLAVLHSPPGIVLLALEGEQVCGTVALRRSWLTRPTDAVVQRLYVPPGFRRRGIARDLMETLHMHAVAAGFHRLVLNVMASRTGAIAFYRGLGYDVLSKPVEWPYGGLWLARDLPRSNQEVSTTDW